MATLNKIRSKAGLLVVIIGVALLAFIVGDFLNSGHTFYAMNQKQSRCRERDEYRSRRISRTCKGTYR